MDIKDFRNPPEGVYRLIEIDTRKQDDGYGRHPDESVFTRHVDDFTDWNEAIDALRDVPNRHCRRQLWGSRGILGVHGRHQSFVNGWLR